MLTKEQLLEYKKLKDKYGTKAIIREPIFIDNFLDKEVFDELKTLCRTKDPKIIKDSGLFSPYMFKTEYSMGIEGKIQDIITKKVKEIYQSDNIINTFNVYAVHKNPQDGSPKPLVSEHLDRNAATYIVDLILHADFDWPIVVHDKVYHLKENQAVLFHPEDQLHYRLEWESKLPDDIYEVAFFHYIEPDHWSTRYKEVFNHELKSSFYGDTEEQNSEIQRFFELKKLIATYQKFRAGLYDKLPEMPKPPFMDITNL